MTVTWDLERFTAREFSPTYGKSGDDSRKVARP